MAVTGKSADTQFQELKEWFMVFLQQKDLLQKKIIKIEEKQEMVIVEYKDRAHYFLINVKIGRLSQALESYNDKHISIVTYNTKENLNAIIKQWQSLSEMPMLSIYFVNPHSTLDKKWVIYPFTHTRISEQSALKLGLNTLFESVEEYKGT